MIQNYLAEPLVKNYTAPKYPLFIGLQNSLSSISHKKSAKDAKADITSFVEKIGSEGEKFVLTALIESLELPEFKEKANFTHRLPLFIELLNEYSYSENFLLYFPEVVFKFGKNSQLPTLVNNLSHNLNLNCSTNVAIALSLYLSDRHELIEQGEIQLVSHLNEIMKNEKGSELNSKILDELLFQISRSPELSLKLEEEYNYLLEVSEKNSEESSNKLYNFLKCDWQCFANETINLEKPNQAFFKKVDYLRELGPYITFQQETLKNVLNEIGPLTEEDIFECIIMMTDDIRTDTGIERFIGEYHFSGNKKNGKTDELKKCLTSEFNSKKTNSGWNIDNFINVCNNLYQSMKWQNVFLAFDRPKLQIHSEDHFLNIMKAFEKSKKVGQKWKVPEQIYMKKWNNLSSQALFFVHLFTCKDPESFFLSEVQNKKIQKSVRDCNFLQKQIWGYIDLVQTLVEISDFRYISIRELFENPINKYPELLLLTLSEIRPSKGQALLDEIFSNILPPFLHNHTTNIKLLDNLWENNQDLIISCICEIYKTEIKKENSFNLSRVLDITQSIKDSLIPFTTWNDYDFSIPLAVIAGKREFLNFEPWLIDRIEKLSNSFVRAILMYVENYLVRHLRSITHPSHKENVLEKAQLTIELLKKIFYTIMSRLKREEIEPRNYELLRNLFKECCTNFPEITENQVPDEVERETEREFNRIYKEEITIKEAIERMKKLKNSNKQEDHEQFASHITFLCSELSYLHKYVEKYINITVDLFSALINANLIEKKIFKMFLDFLEKSLREENQKYTFAYKVLEKTKSKLVDEAFFCERLIDNENMMRRNPELIEELIKNLTSGKGLSADKEKRIKEAIKIKNAPPPVEKAITISNPPEEDLSSESNKKIEQNDYEILVSLDKTKKVDIPDKEAKLSKINMTCNTLSMNNIEEKSKDLNRMIDGDQRIMKLLAYNIVFKRVSITQNNGIEVFYRLIEKMPMIEKPILKITYKILQEWFNLTGKSVNDKKIVNFKNIGSWLSKLTIAKGMPIPIHKLNIKKILIESYTNMSRLALNVSVIIKILDFIHAHPEIFRGTSPWLRGIVGTLSEIEGKLKEDHTQTKNEIKAFFKSMNVQIENIPMSQTSYLSSHNGSNSNRIIISELDKYIKIDPELERKYQPLRIDLKMIITRAVDDSIQEIVEPVIDRAVKIAKVTTKQLITKDFMYEPDPERLRESSYKLVKEMAGPLAQVTCREPLKASMNRSLKNILAASISDPNELEIIIQKAIADNLDLGCTLIKQAVIESAEDVIKKDPNMNEAIQLRQSAKLQGIGFQNETFPFEIPAIVPEELRPRPGGLSQEEYEVYSEFKREKNNLGSERAEERSVAERIIEIIMEKGPAKSIKELIQNDFSCKEEIMNKINSCLTLEANDESEVEYYFEVCEVLKDSFDQKECWKSFKEQADLKKKEIHRIVRKLVRENYFPETSLNELEKSNEEENKVITLFEKWLETAHEGIEPFLRSLEEMFNKSENQIKVFFSFSLHYAMQKVSESFSEIHDSYDTNYIENYTKLIIISYKTIASNNCSLYLEHTIQAILDVFNKLQNGGGEFSYQRPFFKLFTNLVCDVTRKEYDIDHEKVLTFYCVLAKELQKIGPVTCPNFTCAWMELICNKNFMPALLERYEYWDLYYHLLCSLMKFVKEYITEDNLTSSEIGGPYRSFYLGILRLMVVIVHDFQDFLSEFSLQLVLLIPRNLYQLNNIILSAYPKEMKFESPFKIDHREDFVAQCKKGGMPKYYRLKFDKPLFNTYLQTDPKDASFKEKFAKEDEETIQLFVLYGSWSSENQLSEAESMKKIYKEILIHSNEETQFKLINSMLNLVRYPNNVTLFFIDLLRDIIFNKAIKDISLRENILTCFLARTNVEAPQPWGEIYLTLQLQIHYKELVSLNVSQKILESLKQ